MGPPHLCAPPLLPPQAAGGSRPAGSRWVGPVSPARWQHSSAVRAARCRASRWSWQALGTACRWSRRGLPRVCGVSPLPPPHHPHPHSLWLHMDLSVFPMSEMLGVPRVLPRVHDISPPHPTAPGARGPFLTPRGAGGPFPRCPTSPPHHPALRSPSVPMPHGCAPIFQPPPPPFLHRDLPGGVLSCLFSDPRTLPWLCELKALDGAWWEGVPSSSSSLLFHPPPLPAPLPPHGHNCVISCCKGRTPPPPPTPVL